MSQPKFFVDCDNSDPVEVFNAWTKKYPNIAVAAAAIQALTSVIRTSTATTVMGLQIQLKESIERIQRSRPMSISLTAGCQLFERHVTRTSLECSFDDCKRKLIERGEGFAALSLAAE
uniref:Translation initiation factor eIF2B subunit alpha n=1 Tax=Lygus hesperus TaxID=30085 RepID=A0A146L6Q9_LYGHE